MLAAYAFTLLITLAANPYLDQGRRLYGQVRYREAEPQLRLALQVSGISHQERREASDLLVRCLAAQGRTKEGQRVYEALLVKDPEAPIPAASPAVRALFTAAKKEVFPEGYVRLALAPTLAGRLKVEVVDPWQRVAQVLVQPEPPSAPTAVLRKGADEPFYEGEIPQAWADVPVTSATLHALSPEELVLATAAFPVSQLPQRPAPALVPLAGASVDPSGAGFEDVRTAAPLPRPTWPRWVLLGGTVAAAVAGTALVLSSDADYAEAGTPGRSAAQIRALDSSYRNKAITARVLFGVALGTGAGALWFWTRPEP